MKKYIAFGAAVLFVIGCGTVEPTEDDVKRLNDNANSVDNKSQATQAPKSTIGAGDWEVGSKEDLNAGVITPGTYIVTALEDGINCYYATVKDFDQNVNSIIANGNIAPGTNARVVVKANYGGLSLLGECAAKKQVKK